MCEYYFLNLQNNDFRYLSVHIPEDGYMTVTNINALINMDIQNIDVSWGKAYECILRASPRDDKFHHVSYT